jgi:hypothetical protein
VSSKGGRSYKDINISITYVDCIVVLFMCITCNIL